VAVQLADCEAGISASVPVGAKTWTVLPGDAEAPAVGSVRTTFPAMADGLTQDAWGWGLKFLPLIAASASGRADPVTSGTGTSDADCEAEAEDDEDEDDEDEDEDDADEDEDDADEDLEADEGAEGAEDELDGGGRGAPCAVSFGTSTAPTAPTAISPAAAAGTQRGNSGTTMRVPDKRVTASGFGGSATIEKVLDSGRPNHRRLPYTETGTSITCPGATSANAGTPSRSPSATSVGPSAIRSGTLPRLFSST
jgi:hypothetical protein